MNQQTIKLTIVSTIAVIVFAAVGCFKSDPKTDTYQRPTTETGPAMYSLDWYNQQCAKNFDSMLCCSVEYGGQLCYQNHERIKRNRAKQ